MFFYVHKFTNLVPQKTKLAPPPKFQCSNYRQMQLKIFGQYCTINKSKLTLCNHLSFLHPFISSTILWWIAITYMTKALIFNYSCMCPQVYKLECPNKLKLPFLRFNVHFKDKCKSKHLQIILHNWWKQNLVRSSSISPFKGLSLFQKELPQLKWQRLNT